MLPLLHVKTEPLMEAVATAISKGNWFHTGLLVKPSVKKTLSLNNRRVKVHKGSACDRSKTACWNFSHPSITEFLVFAAAVNCSSYKLQTIKNHKTNNNLFLDISPFSFNTTCACFSKCWPLPSGRDFTSWFEQAARRVTAPCVHNE